MSRKADSGLLREINERAIFELVRSRGPTSRAEIVRQMGVSAPTVSKAVANLLESGFLEEVGTAPASGAGRPGRIYQLATGKVQVIGAVIDVRRCCVLRAGLDGRFAGSSVLEFATPSTYPRLIDMLADRAGSMMKNGAATTLGLGISAPGEIDALRQRILLSPNLHMTDGQSPRDDLHQRLGVETVMIHDTLGTCLAEHAFGAAKGMRDFVLIGALDGFGVSVVSGGRLLQGHNKMAGEVGHVTVDLDGALCGCGNRGCLETVATDAALARSVSSRLGRRVEIEDLVRASGNGSGGPIHLESELDRTLEYLAVGVAAVVNIFNPQAVLLYARLLDLAPDAMSRLKQRVAARALRPLLSGCQIIRAQCDTRQGAVAGIIHHLTRSLGPVIE